MILQDYSQLTVAAALAFAKDFERGKDTKEMINILRHTILNTLLSDKSKFGPEYGQIVMAVDAREYWRREYFPQYKGARKKKREESKTDWKSIFDISSQLRAEFKEFFPYKFVEVPLTEGDDIIAVLSKYSQNHELKTVGLFDDEPQRVLIKSNDGDFAQLHKYKNVRQWNPILKKYVKPSDKHALLLKCLSGDEGDGIPNIKTHDNFFMEEVRGRQASITQKIKDAAVAQFDADHPIVFCDQIMDRNYSRNRNLIDFDFIPAEIESKIIDTYLTTEPARDKGKIFNYLIANRCKLLMGRVQEF